MYIFCFILSINASLFLILITSFQISHYESCFITWDFSSVLWNKVSNRIALWKSVFLKLKAIKWMWYNQSIKQITECSVWWSVFPCPFVECQPLLFILLPECSSCKWIMFMNIPVDVCCIWREMLALKMTLKYRWGSS